MSFFANALGFGPKPGAADPRKVMEVDIGLLPKERRPMELVRPVEIDGRPACISARKKKDGAGFVRMNIYDVGMTYTLTVNGPGVTIDSPEVKRFLESASFSITPRDMGKDGARK